MEIINPPYGSVNRLRYVFDMLSTHNFPQLTSSLLKSRGFSGTDAFQVIAALKFLGVIDNDGNKTDKMAKLQLRGEEKTTAILEILKGAYARLFETVQEPNKLNKDDLYNDFISVYGLSGRLASTAVPNFLWLCKEAGLEVIETLEIKDRKPRTRTHVSSPLVKTQKNTPLYNTTQEFSPQVPSVEVGEFMLILPDNWDLKKTRQSIVRGDFKIIHEELTKLSQSLKRDNDDAGSHS